MLDLRDLPAAESARRPARRRALAERLRIGAELRRISHANGKALPPFDRRVRTVSPIARLDDLLDVADAEAVARGGLAVDRDVQVLAARDLLGIDVAGARHRPHDVGHLSRRALRASADRSPKIFTPTSDRIPVVSMSMRLMIGIVQMFETPGAAPRGPSPRAADRASCPDATGRAASGGRWSRSC